MAETKSLITAEQLLQMSLPDQRVELTEGELVRMSPAGIEHGRVGGRFFYLIARFVDQHQLGAVFGADAGFRLAEHTVRAPDVSFISAARLKEVGFPEGFWPGAPDLAVEVVSPDDSASDLQKKIQEYFQAGTRLVWVAYPRLKQVHVYRGPREMRVLGPGDVLDGGDVLPGFSISVEEIFR